MPELFNPNLPGVAIGDAPAWRRSGWCDWDDLTEQEQAAHKSAVDAAVKAEADAVKQRLDRWQTAVDAATTADPDKPADANADLVETTNALTAAVNKPRKPRQTPSTGDTTKE